MRASILLNLASPKARKRAGRFNYVPAVADYNNQIVVAAETIDDPAVLLGKFNQLCDL